MPSSGLTLAPASCAGASALAAGVMSERVLPKRRLKPSIALTGAFVEVPGTATLVAGAPRNMHYYAGSVSGCNAFVLAGSENFRGFGWKHRRRAVLRSRKKRSHSILHRTAGGPDGSGSPARTDRYSTIRVTMPAPTVLLPSRMAKRDFSSIAIGLLSSTINSALSPGMTISTPSSATAPVTLAVRK
jgi:hypothetical protein